LSNPFIIFSKRRKQDVSLRGPELLVVNHAAVYRFFFVRKKDPIYLQSVIIHSANGGKGEGCLVEEYSVALLC
jgi:hypothetical protein